MTLAKAGNGNAGLIFRVSKPAAGADNYYGYFVGLSTLGTLVLGRANGSWREIGSAKLEVKADTSYHLKVEVRGSSISVFVNWVTTPMIKVTDTTYASGMIGVRMYQADAFYDNVQITPKS